MKKTTFIKFGIVGTGMVGTAIGFLLKNAGHDIVMVADKNKAALKRASSLMSASALKAPSSMANFVDCILITTPDDMILSACGEIARNPAIRDKHVFHMSGAGSLNLLSPAKKAGASVASIHPLQSFSSVEGAMANLPGSYFGVTADTRSKKMALRIIVDLQGKPLIISPRQKPLYHAAACVASNYFVTLMYVVESLCQTAGINANDAQKAFLPLVAGSLNNIGQNGALRALTGPIARGDVATIQKHIAALGQSAQDLLPLYTEMGRLTVTIALEKGTIKKHQVKSLIEALKGAADEHAK
ncbi:MAG: DUF2520 domain-containing protein [Smithellaceae bacterium]